MANHGNCLQKSAQEHLKDAKPLQLYAKNYVAYTLPDNGHPLPRLLLLLRKLCASTVARKAAQMLENGWLRGRLVVVRLWRRRLVVYVFRRWRYLTVLRWWFDTWFIEHCALRALRRWRRG